MKQSPIAATDPMQIDILFYNSSPPDAVRSYVEQRLHLALSCHDDYIQWIAVRVCNVYGARSAEGKHCNLLVALAGGLSDVVVEDVSDNVYDVIDRVANCARRGVTRRLTGKLRGNR